MNRRFFTKSGLQFCLTVIFGLCAAASVFAQNPNGNKQTKPAVMILGTYHMGNPNRDLNNVKSDDVRAEKRQKEIAEFINLIKEFKPTKIAVEVPTAKPQYLERYREYLAGKLELKADEIDQIAFRLARELNHKQVYPIDWKGSFDFDKVLAEAKTNDQTAFTDRMMTFGKSETEKMNEMLRTKTIVEMLRYMNGDEFVERSHQPYLAFLHVGKTDDYAGADLTADWYERNLKIFANIMRLNDSNEDRIFVLIGAGHAKLLRQFVKESGEFELAQPNDYLR